MARSSVCSGGGRSKGGRKSCPVNEARHVSDCSQNVLFAPQTAEQMAPKFIKPGNRL